MANKLQTSLQECVGERPDPRVPGRCDHPLLDIIIMASCGALGGAESGVGIETVGNAKEPWFRQCLELEQGSPSHATFGDVFAKIDSDAFQRRFIPWVERVFRVTRGPVVAIDGKTLRGSQAGAIGKGASQRVSAWASANGIVLGQRKTAEKSNEITALPALREWLNVSGCSVTLAQQIRDRQADDRLRVKAHQRPLKEAIVEGFRDGDEQGFAHRCVNFHRTTHQTSGRIELRQGWVVAAPVAFEYLRHDEGWPDLHRIIRVQRKRREGNQITHDTAYSIRRLTADAATILDATQPHGSIENSFHWGLDVTVAQDDSRLRSGESAENMAVLRAVALNLLKPDPSKRRLRHKRFRAAMDNDFLLHLLTQV